MIFFFYKETSNKSIERMRDKERASVGLAKC